MCILELPFNTGNGVVNDDLLGTDDGSLDDEALIVSDFVELLSILLEFRNYLIPTKKGDFN